MIVPEPYLLTAGKRIYCRRCKARSSRTKKQCGRPALRDKNVCQFHGGRSTGPKTEKGKERLRTLNLQHGCFTAEMKAGSRIGKLKLRYLEDFAIYSGLFTERTRGRKPLGYMRLNPRIPSQLKLLKEIVGYSSPSVKGGLFPISGDLATLEDFSSFCINYCHANRYP